MLAANVEKSDSDDIAHIMLWTACLTGAPANHISLLPAEVSCTKAGRKWSYMEAGKGSSKADLRDFMALVRNGLDPLLKQALHRGAVKGEQVTAPVLSNSVSL